MKRSFSNFYGFWGFCGVGLLALTTVSTFADGKKVGTNIVECHPKNKDLATLRLLWEDRASKLIIETIRWTNGMERQQSQTGVLREIQFTRLGIPFSNPESPGKISTMRVETEGGLSLSVAMKRGYSDAFVTSDLKRFYYPKGVRVGCIYMHEEAEE
jgi:hypothetical protein